MRKMKKLGKYRNKSELESDIRKLDFCYYIKSLDEFFYDSSMLREIFSIKKWELQNILEEYKLSENDILLYQNRYLFREKALYKLIGY